MKFLITLYVMSLTLLTGITHCSAAQTAAAKADDVLVVKSTTAHGAQALAKEIVAQKFAQEMNQKKAVAAKYTKVLSCLREYTNDEFIVPAFINFKLGNKIAVDAAYGPAKTTLFMTIVAGGHFETVTQFLSLKPKIDQPDSNGFTALSHALVNGVDPRITQALINAGASVTLKSNTNQTQLITGYGTSSAAYTQLDMHNYLENLGILLNRMNRFDPALIFEIDDSGQTAMQYAIDHYNCEVVAQFSEFYSDPVAQEQLEHAREYARYIQANPVDEEHFSAEEREVRMNEILRILYSANLARIKKDLKRRRAIKLNPKTAPQLSADQKDFKQE